MSHRFCPYPPSSFLEANVRLLASLEDSLCLLVCFSLLQLPLSQLCLSSVCLSCDLLLLSITPDHHITLMIYIKCLPFLRETRKGILQSADPHIACTLHWFGKKRCLVRSISGPTALNFSTTFPTLSPPTHTRVSRMSTAAPVEPSRPVSCVSLCRLSTALRKHAWTHHHCPDR